MEPRTTKAELIPTVSMPRQGEIEAIRLSAMQARDAAIADVLRRAFAGIAHGFRLVANTVAEWPRRRAVYDQLHSLSDRELADIGLTRGDIAHVFDAQTAPKAANDTAPVAGAVRAA